MESPYKGKTGLRRIWNALFYSLDGLRSAYRNESAFRQECMLGAILTVVALSVPSPLLHKAMLLASVLLVLIAELFNSAVEAVVDRVSMEDHALAKRAKDMGSAAVLMSLLNCVVVWGFVIAALIKTP